MAKKKKRRSGNRNPREQQIREATPKAITALKSALIKEANTNRQQEGREDIWNRIISIATLIFVIATTAGIFYQACILNSTDITLKETMVTGQRAYIIFSDAKMELTGGKPIIATYQIKNIGRTPVYDLRQKLYIGIHRPVVNDYSGIKWAETNLIPYFGPAMKFGELEGPRISQEQIDALKLANIQNGEKRLYFIGRATYRDVFNEKRWTDFCFMFFGNGQSSNCEYLNDADRKGKDRPPG